MKVALAQVASGPDPETNLRCVQDWTARAAAAGAQLVVFPEAMMLAFGAGPLRPAAQAHAARWRGELARLALAHGLTVVAGGFSPSADGRVGNSLWAAVPGESIVEYRKIHLYDAFGFAESRTVSPGRAPQVVAVPVRGGAAGAAVPEGAAGAAVRVGLSTCYDVRFPELFAALTGGGGERAEGGSAVGAQVLIVAASWGDGPGKRAQWELLTRARALDTGSFVLAVDQPLPVAEDGPAGAGGAAPRGVGYSAVVAPTGELLAQAGEGPELLLAEIDPTAVAAVRRAIAVAENRVGAAGLPLGATL